MGRWRREQQKAWREEVCAVQRWQQVRGSAGAVVCETRDLGVQWPQRHTLLFEEQVAVPAGCEEDSCFTSQDGLLEDVGSHTRSVRS